MKTFKFFLASLFLMLCSVASAQQVVVTKTNGDVEVFQPNEVDSVVYKPATKYYYYAGWECPMNEEELANFLKDKGYLIGTSTNGFKYNFAESGNGLTYTSKAIFYMILPEGMSIYDNLGTDVSADQFTKQSMTADGIVYNIFTSIEGSRNINYLNIK